jgi:SurA-like protein
MTRLRLLLVASVVAVVGVAGCGSPAAPAATVAGHDISRADLDRDLRAIRDNKALVDLVKQQGGTPVSDSKGTVTAGLTAAWLTQLVQTELVHTDFTKRHLKLTATDRQAAAQSAPSSFGTQAAFNAFPKSFRNRYLAGAAEIQALYRAVEGTPTSQAEAQAAQQKFATYLISALKKAKVKVDHRYGSAQFTQQQGFNIVPPTAPNPHEKPGTTTTTAAPNPLSGSTPSG